MKKLFIVKYYHEDGSDYDWAWFNTEEECKAHFENEFESNGWEVTIEDIYEVAIPDDVQYEIYKQYKVKNEDYAISPHDTAVTDEE